MHQRYEDYPEIVKSALNSYQKSNSKDIKIISKNYRDDFNRNNLMIKDNGEVIGETGAQERDESYTNLLSAFVESYSLQKTQTIILKGIFFGIVLFLLSALGLSGIVILFIALFRNSAMNISVVIGASVDILAVFITIPTIIARHLFPEKIDEHIVQITELLIKNDQYIRSAKEKRIDNNIVNQNNKEG